MVERKTLAAVDPHSAETLRANGATFIDIREPHEHAAACIPGSLCLPLSTLAQVPSFAANPVVFYCQSGSRTQLAEIKLAGLCSGKAYYLSGGLNIWKLQGLPIEESSQSARTGAFLLDKLLKAINAKNADGQS